MIAFYLENQGEVDDYVGKEEVEVERQRDAAIKGPSIDELRRRLEATRHAEAS